MGRLKNMLIHFIYRLYFRKDLKVDEFEFIDNYLKKKGYDEYGDMYSKGFVMIQVKQKNKEISLIEIWVDNVSKKKQKINENFTTGLVIAENYFSRI